MGRKITDFFTRLMQGRYGMDELCRAESLALLIVLVLTLFIHWPPFYLAGTLLWLGMMIHMYYRIFSKNISRRYAENQKYLNARYRLVAKWHKKKKRWGERDMYRYFSCPQCKQEVRVPSGHGKICITCPKCRAEFVKRS